MRRMIVVLALFLTCSGVRADDFVVHRDRPISEAFEGFGAHCNAWLYCKPNWGPISNDKNIKQFEDLFVRLAPQQIRIFVEIQPDSPQGSDPAVKASVIKTIELAKRAGATVNCTLWHGPYSCIGDDAQRMVDMMVDFVKVHGLTNIRYVTLQNEPNEFGFDTYRWRELYEEFDRRLRWAGLRDQIKIIGGDLTGTDMDYWLNYLSDELSDVCDGYSVHMYSPFWDQAKFDARIPAVARIASHFPKEERRPISITEFGFRGMCEGDEEPGHDDSGVNIADKPGYGVLYGCRVIDALNHGFVAMLEWDGFDSSYDRSIMPYGPIGLKDGQWYARPYYHLFYLFTHTSQTGWRSVKVDGPRKDVFVSVMESPAKDLTLYAANRSAKKQSFTVSGLGGKLPYAWLWNADGRGKLSAHKPIEIDAKGKTTIQLPPMSALAASTFLNPELKVDSK